MRHYNDPRFSPVLTNLLYTNLFSQKQLQKQLPYSPAFTGMPLYTKPPIFKNGQVVSYISACRTLCGDYGMPYYLKLFRKPCRSIWNSEYYAMTNTLDNYGEHRVTLACIYGMWRLRDVLEYVRLEGRGVWRKRTPTIKIDFFLPSCFFLQNPLPPEPIMQYSLRVFFV